MDLTLIGTSRFVHETFAVSSLTSFFVPSVALFRTVTLYRRYTEAAAAFEHVGLKNMV